MGQKSGFLNLNKNLVINFLWICSIMKIYIICCVPAQILYWEKSCSWDIGQNHLSQSDCRIFESTISPEQIDETASFFACCYKFTKIESSLKIFWLGMVKNGCGQSGPWTLKLTVFVPACKNQFIPSVHFWDTVNFRVSWPDWPYSFLTMATQIITIHILPNNAWYLATKFRQLIKYNGRNIFLEKSWIKLVRETSSIPLFVF